MLLALGLLLVAGCSDDKSTNTTLPAGDLNDPSYQWVDTNIFGDDFTEGLQAAMQLSFELIDSIPTPGPISSQPFHRTASTAANGPVFDSLGYEYTNDWHIFGFKGWAAVTNPIDTIDFSGTDSIQTLKAGVPQQVPDSTIDELLINAHLNLAWRVREITRQSDAQLHLTAVTGNDSLINVSALLTEFINFTFKGSTDTCSVDVNSDLNATDVVINNVISEECPRSGDMAAQVGLSLTCSGTTNFTVDGIWNATATFTGTTTDFTLTNGKKIWTSVDSCGTGPVMLSVQR